MVFDWGFRCFSDIEGNITNKSIFAFSFLVGKHRETQSIDAKLFLSIVLIGIVAYAWTLLRDNLCRNSCITNSQSGGWGSSQQWAWYLSVDRALHRYRRGHGFESRSGLKIFSGFNSKLYNIWKSQQHDSQVYFSLLFKQFPKKLKLVVLKHRVSSWAGLFKARLS